MLRKNKLYFLAVLIFIISLVMFLFALCINKNLVLEKKEFYATLIIGNRTGFDVNKTALTFGMIMPGSSSTRKLLMENKYNFPIKIIIKCRGDIAKFLSFDSYVLVEPNETKHIGITAIASSDEKYANYFGKVIATIKKDI